jgi:hypothetical protein
MYTAKQLGISQLGVHTAPAMIAVTAPYKHSPVEFACAAPRRYLFGC